MIAVIYRDDADLNAVAIVECDDHPTLTSPEDMRKSIITAVTDWMVETEEGREALKDTCDDFNIGDLEDFVPQSPLGAADSTLLPYLEKNHLHNLTINTHSSIKTAWSYDDHIFDREAIPPVDCPACGEPLQDDVCQNADCDS